MSQERKKQHWNMRVFTHRTFAVFVSALLLSDVGIAAFSYEVKIAQQQPQSQQATRAAAEQVFDEGMKLYKQGTAESLRSSIGKWEEALKLYRQINDKGKQALTLLGIGRVYDHLGENQKALEYYNQALPLGRAVEDRGGEAIILNNIGSVYDHLGEKQKALEYYNQALPLGRAVEDRGGEAITLNNIGSVYSDLGEKQKALEYYNQALPLLRAVANRGGEATTLNNIGKVYSGLGEKQKALEYYNQALPLVRAVGDRSGEATTLNNIGGVYDHLGEKQLSLEYYNQALPLRRAVGDRSGEAATLNSIGGVYDHLGEKHKALEYYNQALPLVRAVGDRGGEATTLTNIGDVYSDLGEKQLSLEYYNQALPLRRAVGDRSGEATTLNNIGLVYDHLGEKQLSLEYYNQALPLYRAVGDRSGEATTLNNIGSVYDHLGENQKALEYHNQALPLRRAVGDRSGEATTLNNIGSVYDHLGEKQKALEYFNQALPLLRVVGNRSGEAITLNNIGLVYDYLGEKQLSLEYYNQALPLLRAVANRGGEATTLSNIGLVYNHLGEKQKALEYYNQALPLHRAVANRSGEATTLNNIGKVYSNSGEKQKALEYYNQALPLRRAVGDRSGEATTLWNLAYTERKRGNLEESLKQLQTAINIIEDLRKTYTDKNLQSTYFASVQDYYQFQIDLLMQLHKKDPSKGYDADALNTSERARARGLVELLAEAGANIRKGVDPKLLATEQLLLNKIDATQKQIQELPAKPSNETRIEALKKESENLLTQYRDLQTKIRTNSPEYAAIQYPEPLELKQIQQQLDKDTVLLQYSLGKDRSYVWAVTPNSLQTYELPGEKQIEDAANNFRDAMLSGATPFGKNNPNAINKPASQLSQIILAPLANKLEKKRLLIVADGVLQNIPFAALADPSVTSVAKSVAYQPLLVNHEIVNLPSVTAIATHRKLNKRQLAPKTLAVLADPVFGKDERVTGKPDSLGKELILDPNLRRAIKNLKRNGLSRLPGTRKEAEAILKLVPPSQSLHVYDFDANYNFATNPELKQYRFLLFATHGIVDTTNPELSGIALTQIDKQGKAIEKGYLRLGDIFNLDLGAELVVLSACETGLGKNVKGEGLMGLTRGLMYAGSKRAVVSLWQVDDDGTSQLMPLFYKAVLHGKSPTVALREAQLQLWQQKEWQNPYYWAPFTLQGEWR